MSAAGRRADPLDLIRGRRAAGLRTLLEVDDASAEGSRLGLDLIERVEERLGVDVIVMDIVGAGYSFIVAGRPVILVDREGAWFRENFTIAHELGHLAAESDCLGEVRGVNDSERAANAFAAELLLPAELLRALDWPSLTPAAVADLVWRWGVSTPSLRYRLENLGIEPSPEVALALEGSTFELLGSSWKRTGVPELIAERRARAARRRFPDALVGALRTAVAEGRAPAGSLEFVLGGEGAASPEQEDVDDAAELDDDLLDGLV